MSNKILRYIELSEQISYWSKDPSKKIGAVAIGEHGQIVATGYNGFPRNIDDLESRYNDREKKYKYVVHAEMNLIYNACLSGISLNNCTLFVYGLPVCSECAKGIIQVGIKDVYWKYPIENYSPVWEESKKLTCELFNEASIKFTEL